MATPLWLSADIHDVALSGGEVATRSGMAMSGALILTLLVSLLVSASLVPPMIRLSRRLNAMAEPGGRHVHSQATPRLGGVAIAVGYFVALGLGALSFPLHQARGSDLFDGWLVGGLVFGAGAMVVLGIVDDVKGIRAKHKLLVQAAVATVVWACGLEIPGVHIPFVGGVEIGWLSGPLTVFWIVAVINAVNLIDGLDGLAGGVVVFAAVTNLVVAFVTGNTIIALVMVALVGSTLGFLRWNFAPAKIFMGDSGSYFLGFVLATTAVTAPYQKTSTAVSILVPMLALGLPFFDTIFAIVRRVLKRQPMFSADRGHLHHRLLDMGLTPRRAVLTLYAASLGFTVTGCIVALGRELDVGLALVGASAIVVLLVRFVLIPRRTAAVEASAANDRGRAAPGRRLRASRAA